MNWSIIDTTGCLGDEIMCIDALLLEEAVCPTIHFYDWIRPTVTYGYFINPKQWLNKSAFAVLDLVRRPTGGGIIFHEFDFAFSIFIPIDNPYFSSDVLSNYYFVNKKIAQVLEQLIGIKTKFLEQDPKLDPPFCMARPTKYDIMIQDKKVVGAAQRKTRRGFLHQGSISISEPKVANYLKDEIVGSYMIEKSFVPDQEITREQLKEKIVVNFCD